MNDYSGYGEIKICDKTLPFKFGTNAYRLLSKERSLEFEDTFRAIKNPLVLMELAYFAHVTANRIEGKVTELGLDEFIDMVGETKGVMAEFGKLIEESKMWGMTFEELVASGKKKI